MLTGLPAPAAFHGVACARCHLEPGHPADLSAFRDGHTWTWRDIPGARVAVCAACRAVEVEDVAAFNEAWGRLCGVAAPPDGYRCSDPALMAAYDRAVRALVGLAGG